jgi:TonB family protein
MTLAPVVTLLFYVGPPPSLSGSADTSTQISVIATAVFGHVVAVNGGFMPTSDNSQWAESELDSWLTLIVVAWTIGVMVFGGRLLTSWLTIERIRRRSAIIAADSVTNMVVTIAGQLGVTRMIRIAKSAHVEVPTVIGWARPIVLLPVSMVAGLSPSLLEAIIAHEVAHIRRHDYVINGLQNIVETVLFFHPAVWWVSRQIRIEREHSCDDLASGVCGDRAMYARALAKLEELRHPELAFGLSITGGELLPRIRRLLGGPIQSHCGPTPSMAIGTLLGLLCVFAVELNLRGAEEGPAFYKMTSGSGAVLPRDAAVPSQPPGTQPGSARYRSVPSRPDLRVQRGGDTPFLSRQMPHAEIHALEESYRRAVVQNDVTGLSALLDDSFLGTTQNGTRQDKSRALDRLRSLPTEALTVTPSSIRVMDAIAVVDGSQVEVSQTGIDRTLYTRVWKSIGNGSWTLLSNSQFRDPSTDMGRSVEIPRVAVAATSIGATSSQLRPMQSDRPKRSSTDRPIAMSVDGQAVTPPTRIQDFRPVYPAHAKAEGISGSVFLEVRLAKDGTVKDAKVIRSLGMLDRPATDAAKRWKYSPTLINGLPVEVVLTVEVGFNLP